MHMPMHAKAEINAEMQASTMQDDTDKQNIIDYTWRCVAIRPLILHYHTIFFFFPRCTLLCSPVFHWRHGGLARCRRSYGGYAMFCPFIALICSFNVPSIGVQWVATAADPHLREVTHGVLSFGKTCTAINIIRISIDDHSYAPHSADLLAHS